MHTIRHFTHIRYMKLVISKEKDYIEILYDSDVTRPLDVQAVTQNTD